MIKYLKLLLNIIKSSLRSKISGILNGRYFIGVEFVNKSNILINKDSWIEPGSRLWATNPAENNCSILVEGKCWIGRDVEIQTNYDSKIVIKKNVSVQDRCKILGSVYIGQDSLLAPDVFLSSGNHYYNHQPELLIKQQDKLMVGSAQGFKTQNSPIVIEEDCWLGKNSIIMKGVNMGRGSIVGANSLVNKDIPPYEIWAGSPAKFIKRRLDFNPPLEIQSAKIENRPYFYRGFDHADMGTNGFLSSNSSVCILGISDKISLFLSAQINVEGSLKIWGNDYLIFDNHVSPGSFIETLVLRKSLNDEIISDLYNSLSSSIKQFLCIVFEFKPREERRQLNNFSINKIEQHD